MNSVRTQTRATLTKKWMSIHEDISYSRGIPMQVATYELCFTTENKQELFACVSQYEFDVVEQGDQGILVYTEHKQHHKDIKNRINIISFADLLIDFKMDD